MGQSLQIDNPEPDCRYCGTSMHLFGIERHPDSEALLLKSYECPHCNNVQTAASAAHTDLELNGFPSPILRLAQDKGFDDEALTLLGSAFHAAWRIVENSGSPVAQDPNSAREQLARCVIAQGLEGERSQARIVEFALASLVAQTS